MRHCQPDPRAELRAVLGARPRRTRSEPLHAGSVHGGAARPARPRFVGKHAHQRRGRRRDAVSPTRCANLARGLYRKPFAACDSSNISGTPRPSCSTRSTLASSTMSPSSASSRVLGPHADSDFFTGRHAVAAERQRRRHSARQRELRKASGRASTTRAERKFMRGEPMNPATKRLAGAL